MAITPGKLNLTISGVTLLTLVTLYLFQFRSEETEPYKPGPPIHGNTRLGDSSLRDCVVLGAWLVDMLPKLCSVPQVGSVRMSAVGRLARVRSSAITSFLVLALRLSPSTSPFSPLSSITAWVDWRSM